MDNEIIGEAGVPGHIPYGTWRTMRGDASGGVELRRVIRKAYTWAALLQEGYEPNHACRYQHDRQRDQYNIAKEMKWQVKRRGMKIVVCGDAQLAHELGRLCLEAGHDVAHFDVDEIESLLSDDGQGEAFRQWEIAVDVQNLHVDAKRTAVQALSRLMGETGFVLSLVYATSVTQAASWMDNPHNLVGFGVVLPLTTPGIVELAKGLQTSEEAMSRAKALWKSLGMDVVEVQEGPGLVRARTICCLINEAASALQEGVATAEDIDAAMRLGTNYPYGPLEWADIIGLDNVLAVINGLHSEYGEDRYRPSPILKRMAAAGQLGKKTGHGFFVYKTDAAGAAE